MFEGHDDITLSTDWRRFPGETQQQYRAFLVYLDMGAERNVHAACRLIYMAAHDGNDDSKKVRKFYDANGKRWAKNYQWENRAASWEQHISKGRAGVMIGLPALAENVDVNGEMDKAIVHVVKLMQKAVIMLGRYINWPTKKIVKKGKSGNELHFYPMKVDVLGLTRVLKAVSDVLSDYNKVKSKYLNDKESSRQDRLMIQINNIQNDDGVTEQAMNKAIGKMFPGVTMKDIQAEGKKLLAVNAD